VELVPISPTVEVVPEEVRETVSPIHTVEALAVAEASVTAVRRDPETATVTELAPDDVNETFPEGVPEAELASLTYIVVDEMVPDEPTVKDDEKLLSSVEISKPDGALTRIPAVILFPAMEKLDEDDATPGHADKADGVPLVVIVGVVLMVYVTVVTQFDMLCRPE
jgi:hypothetical protein